jgi:DnaK suppressor protein
VLLEIGLWTEIAMIHGHIDAELSHDQLEDLAERLASKRSELVDTLAVLNQQIAAKDDCSLADAAEAASLQEDRARAGGVANQHRQAIAEIDLALNRLESGRYGVSETSGEPIGYERLLPIPWARTNADE